MLNSYMKGHFLAQILINRVQDFFELIEITLTEAIPRFEANVADLGSKLLDLFVSLFGETDHEAAAVARVKVADSKSFFT
jgi:hypothetical protein